MSDAKPQFLRSWRSVPHLAEKMSSLGPVSSGEFSTIPDLGL